MYQSPSNGALARFEAATGGMHGAWLAPSHASVSDLSKCLKVERGLIRRIDVWRWRWVHYHVREEALMWLGLAGLRVAHEWWVDRAKADLLVIEESGRTISTPARTQDQARTLEEFLRVFASLRAEVKVTNAFGDPQAPFGSGAPRPVATDEWSRVRSCAIEVKVLGETPAQPHAGCHWAEEAAADS